jgi:hypothetical protein
VAIRHDQNCITYSSIGLNHSILILYMEQKKGRKWHNYIPCRPAPMCDSIYWSTTSHGVMIHGVHLCISFPIGTGFQQKVRGCVLVCYSQKIQECCLPKNHFPVMHWENGPYDATLVAYKCCSANDATYKGSKQPQRHKKLHELQLAGHQVKQKELWLLHVVLTRHK